MKNFILKTLIFLAIAGIAVLSFKFVSDRWIEKKSTLNFSKKADKILIGHSHSECSFNDSKIDGLINLSQSGEAYFYTYFKTKLLLDKNKEVKTVFIEFANNQVDVRSDKKIWEEKYILYRYPLFSPFMKINDNKLLIEKNFSDYLKSYSLAVKRNFNFIMDGKYDYAKKMGGYKKLKQKYSQNKVAILNDENDADYAGNMTISQENFLYLDKVINLCKEKGIEVYLIRSPLHAEYPGLGNEEFFNQVLKSRYAELDFLDFKNFPLDDSEFADLQHLNQDGAKKFSVFFDGLLKSGLLDKTEKQDFINKEIKKSSDN